MPCLLWRTPSAAVTGPRSGCMFQSGWRTHKFFSGAQRRLCHGTNTLVANPATLASAAWRLPKIMKPALLLQLLQASTPSQTSISTTLSHQKSPAEDGMVTNRLAHIHQSAAECASGWLPAARPDTALTDHLAGTPPHPRHLPSKWKGLDQAKCTLFLNVESFEFFRLKIFFVSFF